MTAVVGIEVIAQQALSTFRQPGDNGRSRGVDEYSAISQSSAPGTKGESAKQQ
ncbi:hypothetical protein [Pectobacterium aroidearum]|uniref:hypothetical protein n=1 Tax=Pectobacterium aroidearum TaxID=1201031 RepID=UPI002A8256DA|nr:hypothetical protein [Pectobacterium aroidearum]MDY4387859.1 hypothetical protein [Pectobacterium aroidearum]